MRETSFQACHTGVPNRGRGQLHREGGLMLVEGSLLGIPSILEHYIPMKFGKAAN